MPRPKKVELREEAEDLSTNAAEEAAAHKEYLQDLHQQLKDLNVRSISDLENLIARA